MTAAPTIADIPCNARRRDSALRTESRYFLVMPAAIVPARQQRAVRPAPDAVQGRSWRSPHSSVTGAKLAGDPYQPLSPSPGRGPDRPPSRGHCTPASGSKGKVLGDDLFGRSLGLALRPRLEDRRHGCTCRIQLFRNDLFEVAAHALARGVAVVLETLVGDALDGDASAGLSLGHVCVLPCLDSYANGIWHARVIPQDVVVRLVRKHYILWIMGSK